MKYLQYFAKSLLWVTFPLRPCFWTNTLVPEISRQLGNRIQLIFFMEALSHYNDLIQPSHSNKQPFESFYFSQYALLFQFAPLLPKAFTFPQTPSEFTERYYNLSTLLGHTSTISPIGEQDSKSVYYYFHFRRII